MNSIVFQAIEASQVSNTQRVSGEFDILLPRVVRHLHDVGKNIRSLGIVSHVTKIVRNPSSGRVVEFSNFDTLASGGRLLDVYCLVPEAPYEGNTDEVKNFCNYCACLDSYAALTIKRPGAIFWHGDWLVGWLVGWF